MCATAQTRCLSACSDGAPEELPEIHMYIGGGLLGTVLIIALIIFLLRRA
jgi:nitrate reductase gamma subunit